MMHNRHKSGRPFQGIKDVLAEPLQRVLVFREVGIKARQFADRFLHGLAQRAFFVTELPAANEHERLVWEPILLARDQLQPAQ
jgi:hypothetical protein